MTENYVTIYGNSEPAQRAMEAVYSTAQIEHDDRRALLGIWTMRGDLQVLRFGPFQTENSSPLVDWLPEISEKHPKVAIEWKCYDEGLECMIFDNGTHLAEYGAADHPGGGGAEKYFYFEARKVSKLAQR